MSHHQDKRIVFEGVETKRKGKFEKAIITFLCKTEKAAYWISTTFNRIDKARRATLWQNTMFIASTQNLWNKKGKGKEYNDFCAMLGTITLDLTAFDIDDMNFRLKKLICVYKEIYEYHYEPTERSLGLLLREYKHKGVRGY